MDEWFKKILARFAQKNPDAVAQAPREVQDLLVQADAAVPPPVSIEQAAARRAARTPLQNWDDFAAGAGFAPLLGEGVDVVDLGIGAVTGDKARMGFALAGLGLAGVSGASLRAGKNAVEDMVTLRHYGPGSRADVLDPTKHGTGVKGEELQRMDAGGGGVLPRTYAYDMAERGGPPEAAFRGGPWVEFQVPASKIAGQDRYQEVYEAMRKKAIDEGAGAADTRRFHNMTENALRDEGFEAYRGTNGTVAKFTETPLDESSIVRRSPEPTPELRERASEIASDLNRQAREGLDEQGITYDTSTGTKIEEETGFVVSPDKATEYDLGNVSRVRPNDILEYFNEFPEALDAPGNFFGAWRDNGRYILDVSRIEQSIQDARRLAEEGFQDGIFDLRNKEFIPTSQAYDISEKRRILGANKAGQDLGLDALPDDEINEMFANLSATEGFSDYLSQDFVQRSLRGGDPNDAPLDLGPRESRAPFREFPRPEELSTAHTGGSERGGLFDPELPYYHLTAAPDEFGNFEMGGLDPELSGPAAWFGRDPSNLNAAHNVRTAAEYDGGLEPVRTFDMVTDPETGQRVRAGTRIRPVNLKRDPRLELQVPATERAEVLQKLGIDPATNPDFPEIIKPETAEALQREGYTSVRLYDPANPRREEIAMLRPQDISSAIGTTRGPGFRPEGGFSMINVPGLVAGELGKVAVRANRLGADTGPGLEFFTQEGGRINPWARVNEIPGGAPRANGGRRTFLDLSRLGESIGDGTTGFDDVPQSLIDLPDPGRRMQKPLRGRGLTGDANRQRLLGVIDDGMLEGGHLWYDTSPIRRLYREELGQELGDLEFNSLMERMAATSAASPPTTNIRRATLMGVLPELPAGSALKDTGFGHFTHSSSQTPVLNDVMAGRGIAPDGGRLKMLSYGNNLQGNALPGTMDRHALAIATNRRAADLTTIPEGGVYRRLNDLFTSLGDEVGLTPSATQAAAWVGGSHLTGVRDPRLFPVIFDDMLQRTGQQLGLTPSQVSYGLTRRLIPLTF